MSKMVSIVYARELRQKQTPAEELAWYLLRNRKFIGLKFVRQYPIHISSNDQIRVFYIADFYCAKHKFVLELDGEYHLNRKEYDEIRDKEMAAQGIRVLRMKNDLIIKNYRAALEEIKSFLGL